MVLVALVVRGTGLWRLWAPLIALSIGSGVGGVWFGLYDTARVADAAWIGWPTLFYPGFDLRFGAAFWALLPAFVMVTFVGALDTIGDTIAMQRVAWRRPRAIDFRAIQGSLNADGPGQSAVRSGRHRPPIRSIPSAVPLPKSPALLPA